MLVASLVAFGLTGLLAVFFGVRYLVTSQFMPYHAAVVGQPWSALAPGHQAIILGMLRGVGGGLLAVGIASLALLYPESRGESWAACASLAVLLASTLPLLFTCLRLRRLSPAAPVPLIPVLVAIALGAVAFVLFFVARP